MPYVIDSDAERISGTEVRYWKRMFLTNLKIGVEIETNFESTVSTSDVNGFLRRKLEPSNSMYHFGKTGTYTIKRDGSLQNGLEICTVGRRLNFADLYYQYRYITNLILSKRPIMNERCGLHNHVLLDYGIEHSCMEKNVPAVILKNFIQLVKAHLPEIVWITSTVKEDDRHKGAVTRRQNFCTAEKIMTTTVIGRSLENFRRAIGAVENRYIAINMRPLAFDGNDIAKFHFELRFPDGSIYPMQMASQNILYGAMLLKAIELSEFGLINTGSNWQETKTLYSAIRNEGYSDNRMSIAPPPDILPRLIERANSFIDNLKPSIEHYDTKTYHFLKILAEKPVSILRRTMTDIEINEHFNSIVELSLANDEESYEAVKRAIVLHEITGAMNQKDWCNSFAGKSGVLQRDIENALFKLSMVNKIEFDNVLGTPVIKGGI